MRTIKMLGLAVVAGLMAMALLGASSAMAENTALCTEDVAGACPAGKLVSHVHEVTAGHAKLLTNILTVECNVLYLGNVSTAGLLGSPLAISGNFTYFNCLNGCTAEEKSASSTISVLKEGAHLAKITGEGLVLVSCPSLGLHCTYVGEGLTGHGLDPLLVGSGNGEVRIEGAETKKDPKEELLFCPSTSKLDLLISPLTATYITE